MAFKKCMYVRHSYSYSRISSPSSSIGSSVTSFKSAERSHLRLDDLQQQQPQVSSQGNMGGTFLVSHVNYRQLTGFFGLFHNRHQLWSKEETVTIADIPLAASRPKPKIWPFCRLLTRKKNGIKSPRYSTHLARILAQM